MLPAVVRILVLLTICLVFSGKCSDLEHEQSPWRPGGGLNEKRQDEEPSFRSISDGDSMNEMKRDKQHEKRKGIALKSLGQSESDGKSMNEMKRHEQHEKRNDAALRSTNGDSMEHRTRGNDMKKRSQPCDSASTSEDQQSQLCEGGSTLSDDQKAFSVERHNTLRKQDNNDLPNMVWKEDIAGVAQKLADECIFKHDYLYDCDNQRMGQNVYAYGGSSTMPQECDLQRAIDGWFSEKSNYEFSSTTCNGVCGHYTQIVWEKSHDVGCAVAKCSHLTNAFQNACLIVCNYRPAGNIRGQAPYK